MDLFDAGFPESLRLSKDTAWFMFFSLWLLAELAPWTLWAFLCEVCRDTPLPLWMLLTPLIVLVGADFVTIYYNFFAPTAMNISTLTNFGLLTFAMHEVLRNLRENFSFRRRRVRNIASIGILSAVSILFFIEKNHLNWEHEHWFATSRAITLLTVLAITILYFRASADTRFELFAGPTSEPPEKEGRSSGAEQLLNAMQKDQLFRNQQLSLTRLSEQLDLPEYRLRDVINGELGYRNFNAFINSYRVAYASELLCASSDMSVNEIMRESGFRSHPPFNRAFRDVYGCTPVQYRDEASKRIENAVA